MEVLEKIKIRKTNHPGLKLVDFNNLEFGKYVSDHMLICDFYDNTWKQPQILPYSNLSLNPATLALHYGQTVFEGMKAFKMKDGRINIFRPDKHYERFVSSLERMCMAVIPKDVFVESLVQLVRTDNEWVPSANGSALYLRPFMYASEARYGVKISEEFRFVIFTGPVPALYTDPIKVKIETHYTRAAPGGTGFAKCGGNYGASFLPTREARKQGYDQVVWTDASDHQYIEESGMMNIMFIIGNKLITPALSDSILDGVTRDCLLTLAGDMGFETEERPISINELKEAFMNGSISAAFGAGTAAIVAPISMIHIEGNNYHLPTANRTVCLLKDKLDSIRYGTSEDKFGWNTIIG